MLVLNMLRLIIPTLLVLSSLVGQSQNEYPQILERAKYLHKQEKNIEGAIALLDSVWHICKKESHASDDCMKILTYLAYYYRTNRNYDMSLEHYLMMIEHDKVGHHHGKAFNYISQVLNKKRNHSLALEMAIKGYNHKKTDCRWKHNLSHSAAKSIIRLGDSTLYSQGLAWIDSSLAYYQKCGIGNSKVIANRLNDKGNIYLKMNNHPEAIRTYKKCIELFDNNAKNRSPCVSNL